MAKFPGFLCIKSYEKRCVAGKKGSTWVLFLIIQHSFGVKIQQLHFDVLTIHPAMLKMLLFTWKSRMCHQTLSVSACSSMKGGSHSRAGIEQCWLNSVISLEWPYFFISKIIVFDYVLILELIVTNLCCIQSKNVTEGKVL